MKRLFLFLLFFAINCFAQSASEYFPADFGYKWYFKQTPLDSLGQPYENLSTIRIDSFFTDGIYKGKEAKFILSKAGVIDELNQIDFNDTNYVSLNGSNSSLYFSLLSFIDSSSFPDTGIVNLIKSFTGWYEFYRFSESVGNEYTLFQKDTLLTIQGSNDIPIRIKVTGERQSDEFLETQIGDFNTKKFDITLGLYYLIIAPPFPTIPVKLGDIVLESWIAPENWIVKQYIAPETFDFSLIGLPVINIPGLDVQILNSPTLITLITPNENFVFLGGNKTEIVWLQMNGGNSVIEYTEDNGSTWKYVAEVSKGFPATYEWIMPETYSTDYKIRIIDSEDEFAFDISDTTFTILSPEMFEIISPDSSELILLGENSLIEWNTPFSDSLAFFYQIRGEEPIWNEIGYNISANTGSYNWVYEGPVTDSIKIRMIDLGNPFLETETKYLKTNNPLLSVEDKFNRPIRFELFGNFPNPFNPETRIKFSLPEAGKVNLVVFDILGREISNISKEFSSSGFYELSFDASNFASGVYIYSLEFVGKIISNKMILSK